MALYLKYRPQKLSELDSKQLRVKLSNILSSSYRPHALLFAGPRGTGKTSAARIVAKILNCEQRTKNLEKKTEKRKDNKYVILGSKATPESKQNKDSGKARMTTDIEPCNKCETCVSITQGRNLDVFEIDAASNRGIDEIRQLRENIKLSPISAQFKIYIIDEVHMLTNEAFNALLKTLEEPPVHAVFILATTEPDKLPQTILSRCVKFNFHKATEEEVLHSLKRVVSGEKIKVEDEVLTKIAQMSDGSFRDATKHLEQAITQHSATTEKILNFLGADTISADNFLHLLISKNTKQALTSVLEMGAAGADFRFFTSEILNLLHALLLYQHGVTDGKPNSDLAAKLSTGEVINLINLFSKVFTDLKFASSPQLPLEVAVVEWCEGK